MSEKSRSKLKLFGLTNCWPVDANSWTLLKRSSKLSFLFDPAPSQILHSFNSPQDGFSSQVKNPRSCPTKSKTPAAISNAPPTKASIGLKIFVSAEPINPISLPINPPTKLLIKHSAVLITWFTIDRSAFPIIFNKLEMILLNRQEIRSFAFSVAFLSSGLSFGKSK